MAGSVSGLALLGGKPVRNKPWPQWPRATRSTERAVASVLRSGRWTISGPRAEEPARERQFAEAFAHFHRAPYCVPTANGSSALTIALEALGVGPGKEVLVPGLTWVACGSAVARIGGIPILVDADPRTLCMSVEAARQAITPATAAIMVVHLYCTFADISAFMDLAASTGLPLIEDCSHVHGALWHGRRVGTFGTIATFSMQQTKVLTCGEGGATITADAYLYDLMQQLRADGRRYAAHQTDGGNELEYVGFVQGHNYCLSELHSAVLIDRLPFLDQENESRLESATYLTEKLLYFEEVHPLHSLEPDCQPTFYRYCLSFDLAQLEGVSIELVASALTSELGIPVQPIYDPLNKNCLFDPRRSPRRMHSPEMDRIYDPTRFPLPVATAARNSSVGIPHNALLGGSKEAADILAAIEKLFDNRAFLGRSNEKRRLVLDSRDRG
jgi:L-glutamine:scyllo-inosose aminotransferase/L-glutamine:2-deoxy-scyllo-inosose/3-amino-2,3-dideoxy-scyllo-inosose aminotransferase